MKEMSISSGVIRLIITGMSVDGAVSEFPRSAKLIAVKHGWVFAEIEFSSTEDALHRARELEKMGWCWAE